MICFTFHRVLFTNQNVSGAKESNVGISYGKMLAWEDFLVSLKSSSAVIIKHLLNDEPTI